MVTTSTSPRRVTISSFSSIFPAWHGAPFDADVGLIYGASRPPPAPRGPVRTRSDVAEMRHITSGLKFPEGPIAMNDGSVVLVEIQSGHLTRVSPDGTITRIAETKGGPNGAAVGPDGKVYVCNNGGFEWAEVDGMTVPGPQPADYIGGRIQRVDLDTGKVEDLYTECDGFGLRG